MLESTHIRRLESFRRVTVLAPLTKVGFAGRFVAVGARVIRLFHPFVAVVTPNLSVFPFQLDGMRERGIQLYLWPRLAMAGRIGAKARVVATEQDLSVALNTCVIGLEPVVGYEVSFEV